MSGTSLGVGAAAGLVGGVLVGVVLVGVGLGRTAVDRAAVEVVASSGDGDHGAGRRPPITIPTPSRATTTAAAAVGAPATIRQARRSAGFQP